VEEKMRLVVFTLLLGCLLGTPAWGQGEKNIPVSEPDFTGITVLDLQTAQRLSLEQNPGVAAARARFEQARARVRQASAAWWPSVDVNGQLMRTRRSDTAYDALYAFPGQSLDRSYDSSSAALKASWLLFDGFYRKFQQKQMELGRQSAKAARLDIQRQLISAVAEAFYNAQLTGTKVEIAEADRAFYKRQVADANSRYEAGTGAWGDVLNFKVQLNRAVTTQMLEKRQYEAAMYGLAALLGVRDAAFPQGMRLAELDKECTINCTLDDADTLIKEALAVRPDINRLSLQVAEAEAATGKAEAPFWPKVQLDGAVNGTNQDGYGLSDEDFGNYIAVNVGWNLFSGGADKARLFEAKQRRREIAFTLADLRNKVAAEVQQDIALFAAAGEQVRLQRESVALVEENRRLAQSEYDAGAASLVRLNEAQRDLTTTYSRLAQALVNYQLTRQRLLAATGRNLLPFQKL
jgi:outer membrane protein TolC